MRSVLMNLGRPATRCADHGIDEPLCLRCREAAQTLATTHFGAAMADFFGCASCGDLDLGGDLAEGM
ncbi:MAG TPA: hypothetical protein VFK02_20825 [Kofleriaceae bacterium]|nr:hypothetical protein [Kofleriaceae bacterium]